MFYAQRVFVSYIVEKKFYTHHLEDSYIVHNHIGASFISLLQKDFHMAHKRFGAFSFFLLYKDFGTIHEPFLKAFLCFFDNSYFSLLYIEKKFKNILSIFLFLTLFIQFFFIIIFSVRNRRNFYIVINVLTNLLFLATHSHSSKIT